jgi:outer membrane protein
MKMLLLLLVAFEAVAATPDGLRALHDLALKQSEVIKISESAREQARERHSRARGTLLPSLTARYSYTEIDPPPGQASAFTRINQYSALINLTQPIYSAAAYPAYSFTKVDLELQERLLAQEGLGLWQTVSEAYYGLWMAQNDLESVKQLEKFSEERAKELRERVRVGRSRRGELMQAEAQLSGVKANRSRAENELKAAQSQVDFLVGSAHTPRFTELPVPGQGLSSVGEYLQRAQLRPDIQASAQRIQLSEKEISIAKAGHHPSVDFIANYYFERTGILQDSEYDFGVQVSLPLYQGGTVMAQTREVSERKRSQVLAYERLKREVERDVTILWHNLSGLDRVVLDLKDALKKSQATYEENKKDYRYGLVTSLDVLVSLNDYIDNKRSFERALLEREMLSLQLQLVTGVTP